MLAVSKRNLYCICLTQNVIWGNNTLETEGSTAIIQKMPMTISGALEDHPFHLNGLKATLRERLMTQGLATNRHRVYNQSSMAVVFHAPGEKHNNRCSFADDLFFGDPRGFNLKNQPNPEGRTDNPKSIVHTAPTIGLRPYNCSRAMGVSSGSVNCGSSGSNQTQPYYIECVETPLVYQVTVELSRVPLGKGRKSNPVTTNPDIAKYLGPEAPKYSGPEAEFDALFPHWLNCLVEAIINPGEIGGRNGILCNPLFAKKVAFILTDRYTPQVEYARLFDQEGNLRGGSLDSVADPGDVYWGGLNKDEITECERLGFSKFYASPAKAAAAVLAGALKDEK